MKIDPNTPVANAVYATLRGFKDLYEEVAKLLFQATENEQPPERREQLLRQHIIDHAYNSEAARYIINAYHLNDMPDIMPAKPVFASWRQEIIQYKISGKKETCTDVTLRGIASGIGDPRDIIAADDGYVMEAGRCYDPNSRESHRGLHITIIYDQCIHVRYNRIGDIRVEVGQKVTKGQRIGRVSCENDGVQIDIRRNGRRLDVAEWLGVEVKR